MKIDQTKIWYASYGSNLQKDRFYCYIRGGKPKGRTDVYKGCRNKTIPEKDEELYIASRLYFARKSPGWNGSGVGFISNTFDEKNQTIGRMYLITKEQFEDVVKQETKSDEKIEIDFTKAIENGSHIFKDPSWYGNLIYLGEKEGHPIFTFTSKTDFLKQINTPNKEYLKIIIEGIKEIFPTFNEFDICEYLLPLEGIEDNYSKEELIKLINEKYS